MVKMYEFTFDSPHSDVPCIVIRQSADPGATQAEIRKEFGENIHFSNIKYLGTEEDFERRFE